MAFSLTATAIVFLQGTRQVYGPNSDLTNRFTIHHLQQTCLAEEHECSL